MFMSRGKKEDDQRMGLRINNHLVQQTQEIKLLDVVLDNELQFSEHVRQICTKISRKISSRPLTNWATPAPSGAGVAQLVSARPSELEVPGSILGDSNVCFDFLLICVALALNTRKTEHWQRKGGKVRTEGHKFISYLITVTCYPR